MNTELQTPDDPMILFLHGLLTENELEELEGHERAEMIKRNTKRFFEQELQAIH